MALQTALLERIAAHYRALLGNRLLGLALFGSRARGDERPESDVDLFLVAEELPEDPFERAYVVRPPKLDIYEHPPVSVRALRPAEYERDVAAIDLDIALDGLVLHDAAGYLASRLTLLRRRIAEAGLSRGPDLFWHWRTPPRRRDWLIGWDEVRV